MQKIFYSNSYKAELGLEIIKLPSSRCTHYLAFMILVSNRIAKFFCSLNFFLILSTLQFYENPTVWLVQSLSVSNLLYRPLFSLSIQVNENQK